MWWPEAVVAHLGEKFILDLVFDVVETLELEGSDVGEEHDAEDRVPQDLRE